MNAKEIKEALENEMNKNKNSNSKDLNKKLDYYLNHEDERKIIAEKGKKLVLKNHTFDHRVIEILKTIKNIDISNF